MNTHQEGLKVTLVPHENQTGAQIKNTSTDEVVGEFTNSDEYQLNFQAAEAWLAEHGFVHAGGSDYMKYEPLMTGDTSGSHYE
ncbi:MULTISPECIES: hypothetical protein [Trichocoleus]|uniref:Uncharacterized protein n=1 Tax=Trichocoleus desertorum GB2-A4 TaxID=2933944 RepID=A0ABV0JGG3_9CYAN|nr:hypothetical protein [Trichocoleus sp. FACHB-46]MBD1865300.1 hypothetical protein [Trichocoleus sp. FACHB-46]